MTIAAEELSQIAAQLGKRPRHVVDVAARCPAGHPCVITSYPLRAQRGLRVPFPTLYWLTCPAISQAVAHLERDGVIALVETALAENPDFREALARDHETYIAARWNTLTPEDRAMIEADPMREKFEAGGIGGMTNRAAVKCLHLHVAHHLASGNAIGAWVVERYGIRMCGC